MKAIIGGMRYNTDKAVLVGEANNIGIGCDSKSDFCFWEAGLYKNPRSGRFFLAGGGGPMTRWSRSTGQNSWSGGEGIIPLPRQEALEWAERYLDVNTIEVFFKEDIEDA